MYDDLLQVMRAMKGIAHYDTPELADNIAAIELALSACANKADAALRATSDEAQRAQLRTVYRGLLASKRATHRLAESHPA